MTTRRVLVVDDEPSLLKLMRAVLMKSGYAVETATSVTSAHAALSAATPDLLILDVALGDGNGYDIAEAVAASHPNLPVLMVTGIAPRDPRAPRWPMVLKPFSLTYLTEVVESLLSQK